MNRWIVVWAVVSRILLAVVAVLNGILPETAVSPLVADSAPGISCLLPVLIGGQPNIAGKRHASVCLSLRYGRARRVHPRDEGQDDGSLYLPAGIGVLDERDAQSAGAKIGSERCAASRTKDIA